MLCTERNTKSGNYPPHQYSGILGSKFYKPFEYALSITDVQRTESITLTSVDASLDERVVGLDQLNEDIYDLRTHSNRGPERLITQLNFHVAHNSRSDKARKNISNQRYMDCMDYIELIERIAPDIDPTATIKVKEELGRTLVRSMPTYQAIAIRLVPLDLKPEFTERLYY